VDPVSELALDRHRLEVVRDLVEDEGAVHAAVHAGRRHGDDLGVVLEVEERQPRSLADELASGVPQDVLGGLTLEIPDVQHDPMASLAGGLRVSAAGRPDTALRPRLLPEYKVEFQESDDLRQEAVEIIPDRLDERPL
jgi:hypothetical protein